jgi:probable rRNA maturation factor
MSSGTPWSNGFSKGMRPMRVDIHNLTASDTDKTAKLLKGLFRKVKDDRKMDIVLTDDKTIHDMNLRYRNIDRPTDVLSFEDDNPDSVSLGDVIISLETAMRQAEALGHGFDREVGFLAVHGYLHLKGYDHHNEEDEARMTAAQDLILKKAGLERI